MNNEKQYFPALTGIRAVAAMMVYFHHANPIPAEFHRVKSYFSEFYVGVSFFFVLSGLLIGLRYSGAKIDWKKYFVYRAARIYPMWFILTLLTFFFGYSFGGEWLKLLLLNLSFLKGFSDTLKFTGIDQGWSLTVEECFYFAAPLFIFLLTKKKLYSVIIPAVLLVIGFSLIALCNALNIHAFQNDKFILVYTIFGRSWEFIFGLLLALLYKNHKEKFTAYYNKTKGINWILCAGIALVIYCMYHFREPGTYGWENYTGILLNNYALPLFTGLFYIGLMVKRDIFSKILSTKFFVLGGKASYIFYLIHIGVIRNFLNAQIDPLLPDNLLRWIIKNLTLIIISLAMYFALEEPLNKGVKKIFGYKQDINKETAAP
jgi:peptidoglycan/LPS O-acetylase OafA/YrhL